MLKFVSFLIEASKKPKKEKAFNLNDAKGKLYEILAGSHLIHKTHKSGAPNKFLSSYRDEEGKSPQDVHNYIKSKLDELHPGMYHTINQHAAAAAEHMRNQLAADGHHTIHEGAWTSQAGDHKRFTKEDDPNSDADIMLKTNQGHIGISMKYGGNKDMNLRNNGLDSLEDMAKLKNGELTGARERHQTLTHNLGIHNHDEYKRMRDEGTPDEKKSVAAADESALNTQREMAKHLTNGLANNLSSEDLRQYVKDRVAPQTKFKHYRIHTRTDNSGGATHHMNDIQDDAAKLDHFEHFRVVPHKGGISAKIEGRRIGSEKYEPVLDQAIKKVSGVTKGFASSTKAPYASKAYGPAPKRETEPVKTTGPKRVRQSFVQHVAPKAPVTSKPRKSKISEPNDEDRFTSEGGGSAIGSRSNPNWKQKEATGEVGGVKFKSRSEK